MSTVMQQKIVTFLMFEGHAEEAITLYTSLFNGGAVVDITRYGPGEPGPEGSVQLATFTLAGQAFMAIDSHVSHAFGFTPSISLYIHCETEEEIDHLYASLLADGEELMALGDHGFSRKFGWVKDRFGVTWQLNLA